MSSKILVTSMLRHPKTLSYNGGALLTTSLIRFPVLSGGVTGEAPAGTVEVATLADLPFVGTEYVLYRAVDTGVYYYWNGTEYITVLVTSSGLKEIYSFSGAGAKVITWNASRAFWFGVYGNFEAYLSDGSGGYSCETIPCSVTLITSLPSSYSFDGSGISGFIIIT